MRPCCQSAAEGVHGSARAPRSAGVVDAQPEAPLSAVRRGRLRQLLQAPKRPSERKAGRSRAKPKLSPLGTREYPVQRTASVAALEIRRVGQVKSPSSGHKRARIHDRVAPPRPGRSIRNRGQKKGQGLPGFAFQARVCDTCITLKGDGRRSSLPPGLPNQPANPSQRWPHAQARAL